MALWERSVYYCILFFDPLFHAQKQKNINDDILLPSFILQKAIQGAKLCLEGEFNLHDLIHDFFFSFLIYYFAISPCHNSLKAKKMVSFCRKKKEIQIYI